MKKRTIFVFAMILALLLVSMNSASAHETRQYMIGNQHFQFVVGSLNEPIAVDDKTGVDLTVTRVTGEVMGHDHGAAAPGAVEGLDQTLKVEISAGDQKKVLDLSPVHGKPGSYKANFIPTVQTTYAYRFFGKVNNTDVNFSFSCNPAGHPASPEDKTQQSISNGVTQVLKRGAFGCPVARADLGFPEQALTDVDVREDIGSSKTYGMAALALSVIAIILAARKRS